MRFTSGLTIGFVGVVGIAATIAVLTATFLRETSGIEERWEDRTMSERQQALLDPIATIASNPNFENNVTTGTNPRPRNGDHDGDDIPDNDETGDGSIFGPGTDPTNPDTDGDGIGDGVEKQRGTNPTDPTDGGLGPVPPSQPSPTAKLLIVDNIYKVVRAGGENYSHLATTQINGSAEFKINVEVVNQGGSHTLVIRDRLPSALSFQTGTMTIDNNTPTPLAYDQLIDQELTITKVGRTTIAMVFVVQATQVGGFANYVTAYEAGAPGGLFDRAYVKVVSPENPEGKEGDENLCTICNFYKRGRTSPSSPWSSYLTSDTGQAIEFVIYLETANRTSQMQAVKLRDYLPDGLTYTKGSGRIFRDGSLTSDPLSDSWINTGLTLQAGSSGNRFEIHFSATVEAGSPFNLTNTATATDWATPPISQTSKVTIISKS